MQVTWYLVPRYEMYTRYIRIEGSKTHDKLGHVELRARGPFGSYIACREILGAVFLGYIEIVLVSWLAIVSVLL